MATIRFASGVSADFERIVRHLVEHGVPDAADRVHDIVTAIDILQRNPMIGRRAGGQLRELVIGKGSRGYLALYAWHAPRDLVEVLAIRAQSESGYAR